jgi:hypothetical protein
MAPFHLRVGKPLDVRCWRRGRGRRALSPILATVVIISTTLIASIAVSGFVFGLSGSAENTALVSVVGISIPTTVDLGPSIVVCSPNSGNSFGGVVRLYNSGTASTQAAFLVFTYAGVTFSVRPSGSCTISPESSLYLLVISLPVTLSVDVGAPFTGYVSTANGAEVLFTGSFV